MQFWHLTTQHGLVWLAALGATMLFVFWFQRYTQKRAANSLRQELSQKDNAAMAVSYAGGLFAAAIVLKPLLGHFSSNDWPQQLQQFTLLAVLALVFLEASRHIQAKWLLPQVNEDQALRQRNLAAALVESAGLIANALILSAIWLWHPQLSGTALVAAVAVFAFGQLMIATTVRWLAWRFAKSNQGSSLESNLGQANSALALRYHGYLLALALTMQSALAVSPYQTGLLVDNLLAVLVNGVGLWLMVMLSANLLRRIALARIAVSQEIGQQENTGIAAVEWALLVGLAWLSQALI